MNSKLNISASHDDAEGCVDRLTTTATTIPPLNNNSSGNNAVLSPKTPTSLTPPPRHTSVYVAYPRPVTQIDGVSATPLITSTVGRHSGFLRTYKVLLVGEAGVGKSNLMHRYCYNQYDPSLPSTIGAEFCSREVDIPSGSVGQTKSVVLQLWDTAGQERNAGVISNAFYRNAVGAIVVYDVTRRESLLNVPRWVARVMELASEDCVCVVVGAKVDLLKTLQRQPTSTAEMDALQQEADRISHALGMRNFFTSALSGEGVLEAFTHLVLAVDAVQAAPLEMRREATAAVHQHNSPNRHGQGCNSGDNGGRGPGSSRISEMWTAASTVPASPVALFGVSAGRSRSEDPLQESLFRGQNNYSAPQPNPYSHANNNGMMTPASQGSPGTILLASGYVSPGAVGNVSRLWHSPSGSSAKQKKPLDLRGFGPGESTNAGAGGRTLEASWGC